MEVLDNPLGLDGFAFVEFTADAPDALGRLFETLGFARIAKHRTRDIALYRQGEISFLLNTEPSGHAARFRAAHGPGVSGMGFRVRNAPGAFDEAVRRGAEPSAVDTAYHVAALKSVGSSLLYLTDAESEAALLADFAPCAEGAHAKVGLSVIDHVAFNLQRGEMPTWSDYFERVFNFREVRYFHITGKHTGLKTKAMASPCGKIRIPLNESQDDHSQIEEFLRLFNGEGVQHISLGADDIHASVEALRSGGVDFQATPEAYYEALPARVTGHSEDLARLQANGVLLDGDAEAGLLMQIFTKAAIGPLFFEIIQRKGNDGFGEGNVTALFESVEADQIRRGALNATA